MIRQMVIKSNQKVSDLLSALKSNFPEVDHIYVSTIKENRAGEGRKLRALTEKNISKGVTINISGELSAVIKEIHEKAGLVIKISKDNLGSGNNNSTDNDDDRDDVGFPAIIRKVFRDKNGNRNEKIENSLNIFFEKWQCPTSYYNLRLGVSAKIPYYFEDIDASCISWSAEEIEFIGKQIINENVLPSLDYLSDEIQSMSKSIWWIVPFVIWKEDTASWLFVDKNGINAPYHDDNQAELIVSWDRIGDLDSDWIEDNLFRLTVNYCDGEEYLTFDEFVKDGKGSFLSIIKQIFEVYKPVILASKGRRSWKHGAGKEGYCRFESPRKLLKKEAWKDSFRPDPDNYL